MKNKLKEIACYAVVNGKKKLKTLRQGIYSFRIYHHLYHKVELPKYDEAILEEKYPYVDPCCASNDYFYQYEEATVDVSIIVPLYNSITQTSQVKIPCTP